jgi:hypothetical protein
MSEIIQNSLIKLTDYCIREEFKGYDPYDGLNSALFQVIPLISKNPIARLVWIQAFKRNPINLRKLLLVPKDYNAKGIALFLTGYCNIFKFQQQTDSILLCTKEVILGKIHYLADLLLSLQSEGYSGACWGYNFDWQARRLFFFPKNTPTVVATTFCATALMEAYEITKEMKYLEIALSSADFVLNDLKRTPKATGFLFSYSPLEGNNSVYNASLLGSRLLSFCYHYTRNETCKNAAKNSVKACVEAQNKDGSWFYGELPMQHWIDSFHTGYNLDSLKVYQDLIGDQTFSSAIEKGFDFYIKNFFLEDGIPKYYHNKKYPRDIHCSAQLFVTLNKLGNFAQHKVLANKVMDWTIRNMQHSEGYFYYQLRKAFNSKISYMRWSNAFMFYAMSYYLLDYGNSHE